MSSQQWVPPSRSGGGGGSVRRARERMEAGLPPEMPHPPAPAQEERARQKQFEEEQRRYEMPRPAPAQPSQIPIPPRARERPQLPAGFAKNGQGPIGVAISRPTQVPQWPLAGTIENVQEPINKKNPYQPPAGRGNAPQRPPRPSHVPSMLDASRLQDHTPAFQYKPPQNQPRGPMTTFQDDEDSDFDEIKSPITPSSRPSTISSVGTIPDFPIPMPPPVAGRRSANLGPPPTSRRGASSYYSQASFVSPIPEESPRSHPSHGSYASSAAIPTNWGSEIDSPGYQYGDDQYGDLSRGYSHDVIEEGRESRESNFDDNEDRGLIRSASLGKKAKPTMITTKSSEKVEPRTTPAPQQLSKLERMGIVTGVGAAGAAGGLSAARGNDGQRDTMWPMVDNQSPGFPGGTGLIDKSGSSSETSLPQAVTTGERSPPPPTGAYNAKGASEMLGAYNAASTLEPPGSRISRTPSPGFSRLSAIRRPPRLDIDAVRDAEARGSLTSLPDLIRRATRLAAMMDRGRRPASRLALDDFPSDGELSSRDKELELSGDEKRQSGLSGMLAAFPPPGLATPRGENPRPASQWPEVNYDDPSAGGLENPKGARKGRRCCGLPLCGFFVVLLIVLIVIAAAIVVPLELLVLRKTRTTAVGNTVTPLQACAMDSSTACQNGGSTFLNNGACACICINGFTGASCTVGGATGCTTATLGTNYPNVTLGESIPRLITTAQSNFSIPLNASRILERFNAGNLSCISENALVTFDGLSDRIGSANAVVKPTTTGAAASIKTSNAERKRDDSSTAKGIQIDTNASPVAVTTNTVIPTAGASASVSPSTTTTVQTTTTVTPGVTATGTAFIVTETVLDFARVATLYILEQDRLDAAVQAQTLLQKFFTNADNSVREDGRNITIGTGISANLIDFSINLGNGNVGSLNSTLLSRRMQLY